MQTSTPPLREQDEQQGSSLANLGIRRVLAVSDLHNKPGWLTC